MIKQIISHENRLYALTSDGRVFAISDTIAPGTWTKYKEISLPGFDDGMTLEEALAYTKPKLSVVGRVKKLFS